jgi:hypothetical protein
LGKIGVSDMRFGQKTAKKALFAGCLLVTGEGSFLAFGAGLWITCGKVGLRGLEPPTHGLGKRKVAELALQAVLY